MFKSGFFGGILMKQMDSLSFLKQFPIFQNLTDYEMTPIIDFSQVREFRNREIIFLQDQPISHVYFIQSGKIKIYKTDYEGKEQIVNVLQTNDMFPHQGLFRKGNYPAHAEVIEPAKLIIIPIDSFENFLITHPEISIKMFRVLGGIIVDLQDRLEQKILYNTYDQIIMLLLRLVKKNGKKIDEETFKINLTLTNRELANMIGSSRETVSRTLTQLKRKKLVHTDKDNCLIISVNKLEEEVYRS